MVRGPLKFIAAVVFFLIVLLILIALFEIPPLLMALTIGPMHPELAQVYTMFEIGIILCIAIFGIGKGYAWFSKRWDGWMGKGGPE